MGRPSDYTEEMADAICEALASGKSLRKICEGDDFPSNAAVFRWLSQHEEFRDRYARAREAQADAIFDEMLDIADDGTNDWMADNESETGVRYNGDHVQRARLRIDARKWMAGKLRPKVYGDKAEFEHTHNLSPEAAAWLGQTS